MGRHRSPLTVEQVEAALAYAQRALDRRADLFSTPVKATERSLATLRRQGLTLRQSDFAAEGNSWLDAHLTPEGRRTMLTAIRQSRATARRTESLHSIRLPAETHERLARVANERGLSLADAVALLLDGATTAECSPSISTASPPTSKSS